MKNRVVMLIVFFWFLAGLRPVPAFAADATQKEREQASIEAYTVFDRCTEGHLVKRHDCACIKQRFYEERLAQGFGMTVDALVDTVRRDCPNTPQIAARRYQECVEGIGYHRKDRDLFCTCYANTFARLDARFGEISGLNREGLFALALKRCHF